jgi:aspartate/methionine/tyrosine aminotransferase
VPFEPFALERWMSHYETRVTHDIGESGIAPMTMAELIAFEPEEERAALTQSLLDLPLGYSEARGTEELRTALAATYQSATPEEVLVTTGAIEANFLLSSVLISPGDHVVAVYPAYQQLYSVPRGLGAEVSLWRVGEGDDGYWFDIDELERLISPKTRVVIVNTPHNPTGAVLSLDDLNRVYALAEAAGAYLIVDEAYRWLDIPGGIALAPPARDLGPRAISVGTLSKPFGLPGLRLGWLVAPAEVAAACWAHRDYISLSPGKLSDALAVLALRHIDEVRARNHRIVAENLAVAEGWFAAHADLVSWTPPRAGLLALMRYVVDIPSLDLSNLLAERYGVLLVPGSAFGYEGHLRLGVGQTPSIFAEGLDRVATCLADVKASTPAAAIN